MQEKVQKKNKLRMAAYCRVSTDDEDQLHSFKAQVEYYTKYIEEHDEYEMAGIYADEATSGTSTKRRKEFNRLIADCKAGKIDIVIVKSISRFARNTKDSLDYMRQLRALGIPIYFEKENINSLEAGGELLFTILSSLAQDESRNISENCKWGIRHGFAEGKLFLDATHFLGYDWGEDGTLVINEEQAKIVRRIYKEFLDGRSPQAIAKGLDDDGIESCRKKKRWYAETINGILKNEKHKGDALLQKTYTVDFLTKKAAINKGEVSQYYVEGSHEGIIDRETWEAVQEELKRREDFMRDHNTKRYNYGAEPNPFSGRVFCGECGSQYGRHSWSGRGVHQWQCCNHRVDGKLTCRNAFVDQKDLEKGFVLAYNEFITDNSRFEAWKSENRSPLKRLRAGQLLELSKQKPLTCMVEELAELVIWEVRILGKKEYEFTFMDGSKVKATV